MKFDENLKRSFFLYFWPFFGVLLLDLFWWRKGCLCVSGVRFCALRHSLDFRSSSWRTPSLSSQKQAVVPPLVSGTQFTRQSFALHSLLHRPEWPLPWSKTHNNLCGSISFPLLRVISWIQMTWYLPGWKTSSPFPGFGVTKPHKGATLWY